MRFRQFAASLADKAPGNLGAFFCGLLLISSTACNKAKTPDWDTPGAVPNSAGIPATTSATEEKDVPKLTNPADSLAVVAANGLESQTPLPETTTGTGLRFITFNVENWLTMDRYVDKKSLKGAPKPESEKEAVVRILARHSPDVIGVCEIGTAADLAEIQEDLKAAGLDMPNSRYVGGTDPTRHLGLLSRFPITSTAKPEVTEYQLTGKTFGINRGILDASIAARGKSYRFIGVHLKSKREIKDGDQETIRLNEARLLRRHVDSILNQNADARLVVYGDFNDTRATKAIKMVTGKYNDPSYLTAIPAKDSRQEAWTHYWGLNDIYSRIDYVMVSRGLRGDVDFPAAKIIDDEDWSNASDHRAILAIFR